MPPKRARIPAVGISAREARLNHRSRTLEPAPPTSKRTRVSVTPQPPQTGLSPAPNQLQGVVDQVGALLRTVDSLTAAISAQSTQNTPAPVASDNRRPEDLTRPTGDDPLAFDDAAIDGLDAFDDFDGVPAVDGMSQFHSSRSLSYPQLRARAQALEYVDLAGFLTAEVVASRKESFSLQSVNGVLTMRAKKPKAIIRSMTEWGQAWARFTLVLMEKFPELANHLAKYQGFIFSLAMDYHPAELAIAYDRAFRKRLGLSRSPAYSEPNNTRIFLSVFRTAVGAVCGLCASRSHSTENCTEIKTEIPRRFAKIESGVQQNNVSRTFLSPNTSRSQQGGQGKFCFGWNRSGTCGSKYGSGQCRFAHKCERCNGAHQSRECTASSSPSRPRARVQ